MLSILLQFEYKKIAAHRYDGSVFSMNVVLRDYNPRIQKIFVYDGSTDIPTYLFYQSNSQIEHLEARIDGDNTGKQEVQMGILYSKRMAKFYDVMFKLTKMDNISFSIVGTARTLIVNRCWFGIEGENTTLRLDSAIYTVWMRSSYASNHAVVGSNTLPDKQIRTSFMTNKKYVLPDGPLSNKQSCLACASGSTGYHCQNCEEATVKLVDNSCGCPYDSYEYSQYNDACLGTDTVITFDVLHKADNAVFAFDCASNKAYESQVEYTTQGTEYFSLFRDNSCNMNNVKMTGTLAVKASTEDVYTAVFFRELENTVSNITVNITFKNSGSSAKKVGILASQCYDKEAVVVTNVSFAGYVQTMGIGSAPGDYDYRTFGTIVGRTENSVLTVQGIICNYFVFEHTRTVRGSSLLIGTTTATTLSISDVAIVPLNLGAHFPSLNYNSYEADYVDCESDIKKSNVYSSLQMKKLGEVLYPQHDSQYSHVYSYWGHRMGLITGQNWNSTITMTRMYINSYLQGYNYNNWECGIIAGDLNQTDFTINISYFNTTILYVYGYNGLIGRVLKLSEDKTEKITLAANLTINEFIGGVVGYQNGCYTTMDLYLNMTQNSDSNGVWGQLRNSHSSLLHLFGQATLKDSTPSCAYIVGYMGMSYLDDFYCDSCYLNSHANSYYNSESVQGRCDNSYMYSEEPLSYGSQVYYFFDCMSDISLKYKWHTYITTAWETKVSTFKTSGCTIKNLKIFADFDYGSHYWQNYMTWMGLSPKADSSTANNLFIQVKATIQYGNFQRFAALWNDQTRQVTVNNITYTGSVFSEGPYADKWASQMCGLTCWINANSEYSRIRILGFSATYTYGQRSGIILGHINAMSNISIHDVIVDEENADPNVNFADAINDTIDFPCKSGASDSLKKSIQLKQLINPSAGYSRKTKFIASVAYMNRTGMLFGAFDSVQNATIYDISVCGYFDISAIYDDNTLASVGGIFGQSTSSLNLTIYNSYFNIDLPNNNCGMMGEWLGDLLTFTGAIEGDWSGYQQKGLIGTMTSGVANLRVAMNIKLNAHRSGGIVGSFNSGTINILETLGAVTQFSTNNSGTQDSFEVVGEMKQDATLTGYTVSTGNPVEGESDRYYGVGSCTSDDNCTVNNC